MRSRYVKPGLFENDELAKCSVQSRYLFVGLWCYSDRAGRCKDRPARIKAAIFAYDNLDVDALLNELAAGGFIVRYSVGGDRYIEIPTFLEHQHPHKNEVESKIPANSGTTPVHGPAKDSATPVHGAHCTGGVRNKESLNKDKGKRKSAAIAASPKNPDHQKAVDGFCRRWKEKHGSAFIIQPKDTKALGSVLKSLDGNLGRLTAVLDAYFSDNDKFVSEKRGHDPAYLKSQLSKYSADAAKSAGPRKPTWAEVAAAGCLADPPSKNGVAEAVAS